MGTVSPKARRRRNCMQVTSKPYYEIWNLMPSNACVSLSSLLCPQQWLVALFSCVLSQRTTYHSQISSAAHLEWSLRKLLSWASDDEVVHLLDRSARSFWGQHILKLDYFDDLEQRLQVYSCGQIRIDYGNMESIQCGMIVLIHHLFLGHRLAALRLAFW